MVYITYIVSLLGGFQKKQVKLNANSVAGDASATSKSILSCY